MSHTTRIKSVAIKDKDALHKACLEYIQKHARQFPELRLLIDSQGNVGTKVGGRQGVNSKDRTNDVFDFVLQYYNRENYNHRDVAFKFNNETGSYDIVTDEFSKGMIQGGSHAFKDFMQVYTKHATINSASQQGYIVESCDYDNQGNIQIVLGGM